MDARRYQKDIYYIQSEGVHPFYDDVRWRKGTWGIMAPGVAIKINNMYEMKFAFNFNSAAFYPSYFNWRKYFYVCMVRKKSERAWPWIIGSDMTIYMICGPGPINLAI